jgi:HEAT repeat protein
MIFLTHPVAWLHRRSGRLAIRPLLMLSLAVGCALPAARCQRILADEPPAQTATAPPPAADGAAADESLVEKLVAQLGDADLQVRREASWLLAEAGPRSASAVDKLKLALEDDDPQVSSNALLALARIGPPAVAALPAIREKLTSGDEQRRYRAAFALGNIGRDQPQVVQQALHDSDPQVRYAAATAASWLGPAAAILLDDLAEMLADNDSSTAEAASRSLRQLGGQVVSPVLRLSHHAAPAVRARAAEVLGTIGPHAQAGLSDLQRLVRDADPSVRSAAVLALSRVAPGDPLTGDTVIAALSDSEPVVRRAACTSLNGLPDAAVKALPMLVQQLTTDDETAALAAFTIGRLGPAARGTLPQLLPLLTQANQASVVRLISKFGPEAIPALAQSVTEQQIPPAIIAEIIGNMGPRARAAVLSELEHVDADHRAVACRSLARLGRDPDNVALLVPRLADEAPAVRAAAAVAVAQQGPAAQAAIDPLLERTRDVEPQVRAESLAALQALEVSAEKLLVPVLAGLDDSSALVRRQAVVGMGQLATLPGVTLPESAMPALQARMRDEDDQVRAAAIQTIGKFGERSQPLVPDLLNSLEDPQPLVQQQAAQALGRVGYADERVVTALAKAAQHPLPDLRRAAVESLGELGPRAAAAVEPLQQLQHDELSTIRVVAVQALARVIADPAERVARLLHALDDSDWNVRRQAADCLGDMGPEAISAVPRLLQLMRNDDDAQPAGDALRRIDAAPPEAVPMLIEMLQQGRGDRRRRFYALYLLGKAGPAAKQALPTLHQLREQADGRQRERLDRTIRELEQLP